MPEHTPPTDAERLAEEYRASTGWHMSEGNAVVDAFLAGRASVTEPKPDQRLIEARSVIAGMHDDLDSRQGITATEAANRAIARAERYFAARGTTDYMDEYDLSMGDK